MLKQFISKLILDTLLTRNKWAANMIINHDKYYILYDVINHLERYLAEKWFVTQNLE